MDRNDLLRFHPEISGSVDQFSTNTSLIGYGAHMDWCRSTHGLVPEHTWIGACITTLNVDGRISGYKVTGCSYRLRYMDWRVQSVTYSIYELVRYSPSYIPQVHGLASTVCYVFHI